VIKVKIRFQTEMQTRNNELFLDKSYRRTQSWCTQALWVHQHSLQSFKITV